MTQNTLFEQYQAGYAGAAGKQTGGLTDKIEYFDISKRMVAHSMTESQREVPLVGMNYEPDITAFWAEFEQMKSDPKHPVKISFNTLILKLVGECLKAAPILNAQLKYRHRSSTGKLVYKSQVDISMPMILPDRRMFPVKVSDVNGKSLDALAACIEDLTRRANNTILDDTFFALSSERTNAYLRQGKFLSVLSMTVTGFFGKHKVSLPPLKALRAYHAAYGPEDILTKDDIGEGTVSVTNWGSLHRGMQGNGTAAPLTTPAVFANAIGAVQGTQHLSKDANGEIQIEERKRLPITLLFDHRIGGFGEMVPYIKRMDEIFANPAVIHQW